MSLFEFTIYDQHEKQTKQGEELAYEVFDDTWVRFKIALDVNEVRISGFRQYVLFDAEENPTNCLKIYLSDGSILLSPHSFDKFKEMYNDYLEIIKKAT